LQLGLALIATICCIAVMATPQEIANAMGKSAAFARMIINGKRSPSLANALKIFDGTGEKLGPLRDLSDEEIATARRMADAA